MNRTFAETLRSTGQFSTHFVSLTSDVEKFGKNLDGGKLKLRQYCSVKKIQNDPSKIENYDLLKNIDTNNNKISELKEIITNLSQFHNIS